jgi:hypothetical protein
MRGWRANQESLRALLRSGKVLQFRPNPPKQGILAVRIARDFPEAEVPDLASALGLVSSAGRLREQFRPRVRKLYPKYRT